MAQSQQSPRAFRTSLWLLCVLVVLLVPLLHLWAPVQHWSNAHGDWLIRQRATQQAPDPRIVVIDIDDTSLQALAGEAGKWPWPRALHAELLEHLLAQQAEAVVFDVLFSEADRFHPDADAYFGEVLASSERVYLAALQQQAVDPAKAPLLADYPPTTGLLPGRDRQQRGVLLLPWAVAPQSWKVGTINFSPDADGVGRRYDIHRRIGDWRMPSLPARVAQDRGVALPDAASFLLDWRSAARVPYPRAPFAAALAQARGEAGALAADYFAGKIVVIGTTAAGLYDLRRTPLDDLYPAVFILATAIDNLLNQQQLQMVPAWAMALFGVALLLALQLVLLRERLLAASLLTLGASLVLLLGAYLLILQGVLLPVLPSLLALWLLLALALAVFYRRRRQQLANTISLFSRFLDPQVVAQLVAREDPQALLASRECQLTVLFSDIRNFTSMSERHSAQEIMQILENYFAGQVDVLFRHHATLDKFIGDAIMAFWGAPQDNPNQAVDAVNAALEMIDNVERYRRDFDHPDFDIGIGLHSGPAVVGMVGTSKRYDYTAIGDTVNLASRIEGLTKGRARLLVSAATMQACGDAFDFVPHGDFQVKGRVEPVTLFEPRRKTS
ncbi:adenylate/guanylate cyclase domain-containing protein [Aquipseudomonas alcaligenes]|uniref:Adenylate/guanylate cyclase domain-containing protein n=1 Tax=Aquipseudomonas alcaligenes TaxID=43263 RepID=A0A2V4KUW8_AQUAC|nr:adenylate/guanylate cyclase domain-containing protein [Pseudomonas alcaligenes]PYC23598.1 adenylate/guanylate cyclase domain-containing protein [Pseudomonas alcaligenes]